MKDLHCSIEIYCPDCDLDYIVDYDWRPDDPGDRMTPGSPAEVDGYVERITCKCGTVIDVKQHTDKMLRAGYEAEQEAQEYADEMKYAAYRDRLMERKYNAMKRREALR